MEKALPNKQSPKLNIKITPSELKLDYIPNKTTSTTILLSNQTKDYRAFSMGKNSNIQSIKINKKIGVLPPHKEIKLEVSFVIQEMEKANFPISMGELKISSKQILDENSGDLSLLLFELKPFIKSSHFWEKGDIEKNTIKIICFDSRKKPTTIELPNQANPLPLLTLEKYSIDKTIGKGQFPVYQVTEISSKQQFAAKLIEIQENDLQKEQEILNECSLLSQFAENPNFVGFKGVIKDSLKIQNSSIKNIRYGILMELMKTSLDEEIKIRTTKKQYYEIHYITRFLEQTYAGFVLLEKKKIAHRDIKPQNILIDQKGNYKIADLGVSKIVQGVTGTIVGTLHYLSPELMHDYLENEEKTHCDHLISDVFSYGLTLLKMVTFENIAGINLPDSDNKMAVFYQKIKDLYKENGQILIEILRQLLERNAKKRKGFKENKKLVKNFIEKVMLERARDFYDCR